MIPDCHAVEKKIRPEQFSSKIVKEKMKNTLIIKITKHAILNLSMTRFDVKY